MLKKNVFYPLLLHFVQGKSKTALVRALLVSGHGPCSQPALHPWAGGDWVNKSVWGLWWALKKFNTLQLTGMKCPSLLCHQAPKKPRQSYLFQVYLIFRRSSQPETRAAKEPPPALGAPEGAIGTKIPLWHPLWMAGSLWLWGVRL